MGAAWWHPGALAALAALAAALGAYELGTLYAPTGLRISRVASALLAAGLVARWAFEAPAQVWVDLTLGLLAGVTLLRQLARPAAQGRFTGWAITLAAAIYAGGLLGFGVALRRLPHGFLWVLLALGVTWACDTCAYLVGRRFGRHGFMTHISPRKTAEGALAGLAGTIAAVALFVPFLPIAAWQVVPLGAGWAVAAQAGDLVESMVKRDLGVKDSSSFIPGHGGILDRIDSLLFVAPAVFAVARLAG
ncbi:MAG: phosphatidate cytidylyltransferase [Actinobacteria bacterium]|nr:phosphatidate cytidylyltransferase [Actinomycetota bacterium]